MALTMDALGKPEETSIILESKPAPTWYIDECINNHGYHKTTRCLQFSASKVGSNEADTLESYSYLQHLHILTNIRKDCVTSTITTEAVRTTSNAIGKGSATIFASTYCNGIVKRLHCSLRTTLNLTYLSWGRYCSYLWRDPLYSWGPPLLHPWTAPRH
jgi:hypothetical protein